MEVANTRLMTFYAFSLSEKNNLASLMTVLTHEGPPT